MLRPHRRVDDTHFVRAEQDEDAQPSPPIMSLPPEVLAHVFDQLEDVDVVSTSRVHPDWLDIANRHVLLPRGHFVLTPAAPCTFLEARLHPTVHTLHLVAVRDVDRVLQAIARVFPLDMVESVWIHEHGAGVIPDLRTVASVKVDLDAILKACSNMRSLNFFNVPQCGTFVKLLIESVFNPHVRTRCVFSLRDHNARDVGAILDEMGALLQEAVVTSLNPVQTVAHYPHYWEPVRKLRLPYMSDTVSLTVRASGLSNDAFKDIAKMQLLESLHVEYADGLDDDAMVTVVKSLPHLRTLSVHDAVQLTGACWANIFRSAPLRKLEELRVSGCPQIDDSAFSALREIDTLTRVDLDLQDCRKFSRDGFELMFTSFPNLEQVSLTVPFALGVLDGVLLAPRLLTGLRKLVVRVQGHGSSQEAVDGVDQLRKALRTICPTHVQLDVTLTFLKLELALSCAVE